MADERREPYTPPVVRRIRLAAEELAATACKSQQVGFLPGPSGGPICLRGGSTQVKSIGS